MPLSDTPRYYGTLTRVFHWTIALLLFWRTLISGLILLPFAVFFGPGLSAKAVLAAAQAARTRGVRMTLKPHIYGVIIP